MRPLMALAAPLALLASTLTLTACSSPGDVHPPPPTPPTSAPSGLVKGTITSREPIVVPPDAVIDLWIADASPGIVIAAILSEASVPTAGRQVPIPFEVRYDPARIAPDHDYQIKAVIRAGGRTLFETQEKYPVITRGTSSEIELSVVEVP